MGSVSYKIKIKASINGVEKTPSKITWIQGNDECLLRPCYKENDYLIVELLPDCTGDACIEGYLVFDDTCANCEPIHFKRCFCSNNADCGECEECNNGVCVSKCLEGEFCKDDKCLECDPNHPCENGKECINGRCVCPQGFFEKNGQCVQCDSTTELNKCQECKNGLIIDKPCAGACDPVTGDCVGCNTSGDCYKNTNGKNCCNPNTKDCDCCPGTRWDASEGQCVPIECDSDADCGDPCMKCTPEGCREMRCPNGYKCWEGECVPWDCKSTTCNNGADCGPNCGCLNGECVPCAILECIGECSNALGCKCNGDRCESSDKCSHEYCDGLTPCSGKNCTCYNNECVDCSNFPCDPDDCSNRINCGCSGGDCGGDSSCNDKFELKQNCGNKENDCYLEANLTLKNGCKCEPIKFITNFANKSPNVSYPRGFDLKIDMYKNNVLYSDTDSKTIGDNEKVQGTIKVTITHKDKNGGILDPSNLGLGFGVTNQLTVGISNNNVGTMSLFDNNSVNSTKHYSLIYAKVVDGVQKVFPTKIEIKVEVEGLKVPNNGCINYNKTTIAEYSIDFKDLSTPLDEQSSVYNYIHSNITESIKYSNDTKSTRKPYFIWSKSYTNGFSPKKFEDNGVYEQSGYFRKEYGTLTNGVWKDKISNTEQGLVNNYNYLVETDCGCMSARSESISPLEFRCFEEITPQFSDCNKKVKIPSFNVCSINGKINSSNINDYNKSKYKIVIKHEEGEDTVNLAPVGNSIPETLKSYNSPITNIKFYRYFDGGILKDTEREIPLNINLEKLPEITFSMECNDKDKIVTIKMNSDNRVVANGIIYNNGFAIGGGSISLNNSTSASKTFGVPNPLDLNGNLTVKVSFPTFGSCIREYNINQSCSIVIAQGIPDKPSYDIAVSPQCSNGIRPNIYAETFGLGDNVEFSLNGGVYQDSNVFEDMGPGTHTITARNKDTGDTASTSVVIGEMTPLTVQMNPSSICAGQIATMVITGKPNSSIRVRKPDNNIVNVHTNSLGTVNLSSLGLDGVYEVYYASNPGEDWCDLPVTVELEVGGVMLNPIVKFQPGTYCQSDGIPFTIQDSNNGKIYTLTTTSGVFDNGSANLTLGSNQSDKFYPTNPNSWGVSITGVTPACDSLPGNLQFNKPGNVTVNSSPIISNVSVDCIGGLHTISANVTPNNSSVKIGDVTLLGFNGVFTRTGIVYNGSPIIIEATSNNCTSTYEVQMQSCDCPNYNFEITIDSPTCGEGTQRIDGVSFGDMYNEYTIQLEQKINGVWTGDTVPYVINVPTYPAFWFDVTNQLYNDKYYRVTLEKNGCKYYSNEVVARAYDLIDDNTPGINIVASPNPALINSITTLSISGITPDSIIWSGPNILNNITDLDIQVKPTSIGTYQYSAIITVGSCTFTKTFNLEAAANCGGMTASISVNPGNDLCSSLTANPLGGTGPYTYKWNVNIQPEVILSTNKTITANEIIPGGPQLVQVEVTDSLGCKAFNQINHNSCVVKAWNLNHTPKHNIEEECKNSENVYQVRFQMGVEIPCIGQPFSKLFAEFYISNGMIDTLVDDKLVTFPLNSGSPTGCKSVIGGIILDLDLNTYNSGTYTVKIKYYNGEDNLGEYMGEVIVGTINIPASCP